MRSLIQQYHTRACLSAQDLRLPRHQVLRLEPRLPRALISLPELNHHTNLLEAICTANVLAWATRTRSAGPTTRGIFQNDAKAKPASALCGPVHHGKRFGAHAPPVITSRQQI